jgi:hypothetical protein
MTLGSEAVTDLSTIITEIGESVTLYANTETIDAQSGERTNSYGTGSSITVAIQKLTDEERTLSPGLTPHNSLAIIVKSTDTVNAFDKISHDSVNYEVVQLLGELKSNDTVVYRKYLLKKVVSNA